MKLQQENNTERIKLENSEKNYLQMHRRLPRELVSISLSISLQSQNDHINKAMHFINLIMIRLQVKKQKKRLKATIWVHSPNELCIKRSSMMSHKLLQPQIRKMWCLGVKVPKNRTKGNLWFEVQGKIILFTNLLFIPPRFPAIISLYSYTTFIE